MDSLETFFSYDRGTKEENKEGRGKRGSVGIPRKVCKEREKNIRRERDREREWRARDFP